MIDENGKQADEHASSTRAAAQQSRCAARWLEENRGALAAYNAMIEKNGLPLDEYRQF